MEAINCDVIGCAEPAAWVSVGVTTEADFLCQSCWSDLNGNSAAKAGHYIELDREVLQPSLSSQDPDPLGFYASRRFIKKAA